MDSDGFGTGFEEYARADMNRLMRLAYVLTGNRHDAHDAVQETLVRVGMNWKRIDERGPHAYATTVMSRFVWRNGRRQSSVAPGTSALPSLDALKQIEDRQLLRDAMNRLGAKQRTIIALRYYCDLPETEIADVLRCSLGTVKSQTSRGLQNLHTMLGQSIAEPHPQLSSMHRRKR